MVRAQSKGAMNYGKNLVGALVIVLLAALIVAIVGPQVQPVPKAIRVHSKSRRALDDFINEVKRGRGFERENYYAIPSNLDRAGIFAIWRENDFVFFMLNPTWIDGPEHVLVFDLTSRRQAITALVTAYPRRFIYRVEELKDGWYYWMYS